MIILRIKMNMAFVERLGMSKLHKYDSTEKSAGDLRKLAATQVPTSIVNLQSQEMYIIINDNKINKFNI